MTDKELDAIERYLQGIEKQREAIKSCLDCIEYFEASINHIIMKYQLQNNY